MFLSVGWSSTDAAIETNRRAPIRYNDPNRAILWLAVSAAIAAMRGSEVLCTKVKTHCAKIGAVVKQPETLFAVGRFFGHSLAV